ncbi:Mur ligase [Rhodanobacter glycinis]|uniref:Mur ligase n=1 Tax=Rhodanobacter glycinis TaxID=582702 RepID=A0A502C572_9GAMM|nr:Mur ligase [Rhodanobacter glycinis]TPG44875.1 Mur ligase [Rhodanobacter glycinis]
MPFDDSRRLTGCNLYFDGAGAVLETVGVAIDDALLEGWRTRSALACHALGWADAPPVVRRHASGAALAFEAPIDQLFSATEVNEWAWLATLAVVLAMDVGLHAPGHPAAWDEASALHTLRASAAAERRPELPVLLQAAEAHGLTVLIDDEVFSIGEGTGVRSWPLKNLPAVDAVPWPTLHDIPVALVTGSNGKTTTVRLLAAMAHAHGWHAGHSCTDGVFVDGRAIDSGDFSGPAGAREVLRQPQVEVAVLETARGGILRRGLAVQHANVAVVTNVSDDHFGEYGIHDLDGLATVKLTVACALGADGLLVVNADDAVLVRQAAALSVPLGWFALDDAHPLLRAGREQRGSTCGVHDGRLHLFQHGVDHDLGVVAQMPLSFAGSAGYNIANIAAAALAAAALRIPADTIASVLARFGSAHADNPGRLQHWRFGALQVFVDYAHNPEGLRGLLGVATASPGHGRLGLVLGQAGNRENADIRELAAVAAGFQPQRVVLKDIDGFMRGRVAGEVAGILRDALVHNAVPVEAIVECLDELDAVRGLLAWARDADVLVLPTHGVQARQAVVELLDGLQATGWSAGTALPEN